MPPTYSATSGFSLPSAPATSLSTSTCTEAWTEKSFRLLPLPARRKPSSSQGLYSSMTPGMKPMGSQPSAISAVSLTVDSFPVAR